MFLLWGLCYAVSPTKNILGRLPMPRMQAKFAKANARAQNMSWLKKIPPENRGAFSLSLVEMFVLKAGISPFTLPIKVWFTGKLLMIYKRGKQIGKSQEISEEN